MSNSATSNVAIVESIYEAFERGDLDAVLGRLAHDVDWLTPSSLPWSKGDYHGRGEVVGYFASFLEQLSEPTIDPEAYIDAADHVVVHGHERARAAGTGRPFAARFTHTWTLRDGLVTEMRGIVDTAVIRHAFTHDAAG